MQLTQIRDAIREYFEYERCDVVSDESLRRLRRMDDEKKQIERSPWIEFERRPGDNRLIVPEAWRTQPLPNHGYVELRYSVGEDVEVIEQLWGRAVWPEGVPYPVVTADES